MWRVKSEDILVPLLYIATYLSKVACFVNSLYHGILFIAVRTTLALPFFSKNKLKYVSKIIQKMDISFNWDNMYIFNIKSLCCWTLQQPVQAHNNSVVCLILITFMALYPDKQLT